MADQDKANQIAVDAGNDVRDSLHNFLGRGMFQDIVTNLVAALVAASVTLVVAVLSAMFRIGADLVALFLETLEAAREQNFDAINKVIAAAMGDLLSIDINPDDLPTPGAGSSQIARVGKLGGAFHDTLYEVFGAGSPGTIGQGEQAARAFTGFGLSYAANAALTGLIPELESLGFFKEFALIGEEIGESLGLGRLHRIAIRPLIDALIATPLKQELNTKFGRELLPASTLAQLSNGGIIGDDVRDAGLMAHGFTADNIALLLQAHRKPIPLPMLDRAIAAGLLTRDAAIEALKTEGFTPEAAELMLQASTLQRQEALRSATVHEAFSMARDRHMTDAEFSATLESLQVPADEAALWKARLDLYLNHPHKRLSIAEIIYLSERNQLTSDYVQQWAIDSGYSEDDSFILGVYVDLKDTVYDAAQAAKAAKKKAADAKLALKQAAASAVVPPSGQPGG